MKIAIFHNYIDNIGGAEIVALTLARELDADIYTTNVDEGNITKMGFADLIPRIKSLGKIPNKSPFKQQFAFWKFRKLNLQNKYDFYIIAGDWAMSGAVNNKPNLWYVHGPTNELWEWTGYIKKTMLTAWQRPIFDLWVFINRALSRKYAKHVGVWVCNSKNSQDRIKRFYKQEATVINPPIDTLKYTNCENVEGEESAGDKNKDGYWLSVNRLISAKRIEIQIEAFKKLKNRKLIIIGSYEKGAEQFEGYKNKIEGLIKSSGANIQIIHWATDEEKNKLYSECIGFITTSMDEDFGMTVVEAMASGKPVIAPNEGGYRESVVNGENGILIDDINGDKLAEAIENIEKDLELDPKRYIAKCRERAEGFDVSIFIKKIKSMLN